LNLLRFPEQIEKINTESIPISKVVEELTRYDASVQATVARTALQDVELGNQIIRKGEHVVFMLGAGNRDPEKFINPDEINFYRKQNNHLSFLTGIHNCLGQNLARLEIKIVLERLLPILSNFQLTTDKIEWQESFSFRGPKHLPVEFIS
jgi:cytochrome P450